MNNLADFKISFIYHKSQFSSEINDMYDANDTRNYCICSYDNAYIWFILYRVLFIYLQRKCLSNVFHYTCSRNQQVT